MEIADKLKNIIANLPDSPGVYQYFDELGKVIYVGKAKSLKKRVSSYFNRDSYENRKTFVLVKNIRDIKFILVNNEFDALLLENSLIKKLQPRYNINLKDDKTYPWICITNEIFPRIFPTRKKIKGTGNYYGPYASVGLMHGILQIIKELFYIRTCNLNLTEKNIAEKKFKVCLEYHIKNCKAPCENLQSKEEYNEMIEQAREIIKGNTGNLVKLLKQKMNVCAENYEFEKAHFYKTKLEKLEKFNSKSTVVHQSIHHVDVISITEDVHSGYLNFMRITNGSISLSDSFEIKKKLDEKNAELMNYAIAEIIEKYGYLNKEIIVNCMPEIEITGYEFLIPQRGDKKKLLELSLKNVLQYAKDKQKQIEATDPESHVNRIMQQMQKDLRLKEEPRYIECFDNSNFQGDYAVSAMTVFKDGKPSKKDYRHFNVKTVEGPDDFATMEEVIFRRYNRLLEENLPMPQLIVIDGGKGQLSAACKSLEKLNLFGKIGIIGIAKRLEEIYYPGDSIPLYLDKRGETLKIIQHIRDEAHRFGITHHRKKRDKGTLKTELNEIKGISEVTSVKLLRHFKSVSGVKKSTLQELIDVIGNAKATIVFNHYNSESSSIT